MSQVFWVALLTAVATGLGALPFAFVNKLSDRSHGFAAALAAGMMLSASVFTLADKALHLGSALDVITGMLTGAVFFTWTARGVERTGWQIHNLSVADSRAAILMIVTMFVHSIPEGIAIGVGYATGELRFGLLFALAIAVHNIPEGTAVSIPLREKGVPVWMCAGYSILTSTPRPITAVPAFLLVSAFSQVLPFALGFAGGAMMFLATAELVPDSLSRCSKEEAAWGVMIGMSGMLWLTSSLGL